MGRLTRLRTSERLLMPVEDVTDSNAYALTCMLLKAFASSVWRLYQGATADYDQLMARWTSQCS
jgi:hypothetical protein